MRSTTYKRRNPGTLKEATNDLIERAGGKLKASDLTGWPRQYLQNYTDEEGSNARLTIPVGLVRTLETHVGEPVLTRYLAAEQGCILLKIPDAAESGQLGADCAAIAQRASDLFAEIGRASSVQGAGGAAVTPGEAGRLIAELDDLFAPMGAMRSWLIAVRDRGEKP